MSWFSKVNPVDTINKNLRIDELEQDVLSLKRENATLKQQLADIGSEVTKATPMIDFDSMRVFSIERMWDTGLPKTIIGYYMNEPVISSDGEMIVSRDVVKEWSLYCSQERHEELVREFKKWKGSK